MTMLFAHIMKVNGVQCYLDNNILQNIFVRTILMLYKGIVFSKTCEKKIFW